MRTRIVKLVGLAVLAAPLIAACGSDDDEATGSSATSEAPVATVGTSTVDTTTAGNGAVQIADVHQDFEYYGACGNEVIDVEDTTFYPVLEEDLDEIDETRYPVEANDSETAVQSGLVRVPAPGPGDDVGTMIVYTDGMARFESESGRIIWLIDDEQTYNWVC